MFGVRRIDRAGSQDVFREPSAVLSAHDRSPNALSPQSSNPTGRREWTINGDFVSLSPNGVARYAREVTCALDALMAEQHPLTANLDLELLVPRALSLPDLKKIKVRLLPEFSRPRLPQYWVQLQLPRQVRGGLLSFCNLAPVLKRKQIVCIHDLHTWLVPESYSLLFRWMHRVVLPIVGRRSCLITTVSEFSRKHLTDFRVAPAEKIVVTYNGSDHVRRWREGSTGVESRSGRPFVVCFGQKQKYKNTGLVLQIAKALDEIGVDIWIVGDLGPDDFRRRANSKNVRVLGRLPDADLAQVISSALCLLFPSRIEGFGLPVVEAMALGCPVIASSAPCLPEICGNAAMLIDPDDEAGWIAGVRELKNDPELRERMIRDGYEKASLYSWRKIALLYLEMMAEIDKGGTGAELSRPRTRSFEAA